MKTNLKNGAILFFSFILLSLIFSCAQKRADRDTHAFRYELEPVSTGAQGTYLIKVWTYSSKPEIAISQAKKNAVHGVIFKGFAGTGRVQGQRPLATNPNLEFERKDFFEPFFERHGPYQRYVSITGDGSVRAEDRLRVGNEYKIGVVVSVDVANLRKHLEEAGIIRGLGSGF